MTEYELRAEVVETAKSFLGCKESDGSHRQIIDLYNSQKPLPVGYKVTYTDAWCATFVSAVGVKMGLTDIILPECSCSRMVALYQKAGHWTENDAYVPNPGDIIMYDWQDSGTGDNTGAPDHVGMVVSVSGSTITVIEGNKNDSVSYRSIQINGRYIRGYCLPNYASKATGAAPVVDWAGDAKKWATSNGLIQGTGVGADGKTEYAWNSGMTRAQFVTVLYRFAKLIGKA
jgi:hypothetical protein